MTTRWRRIVPRSCAWIVRSLWHVESCDHSGLRGHRALAGHLAALGCGPLGPGHEGRNLAQAEFTRDQGGLLLAAAVQLRHAGESWWFLLFFLRTQFHISSGKKSSTYLKSWTSICESVITSSEKTNVHSHRVLLSLSMLSLIIMK